MNLPLVIAGAVALLGAVIHGGAGEALVVRQLAAEQLPPTRFGGRRVTKSMIHASWHLATVAFLTAGVALIAAGSVLDGEAAQAVALVAASAATGFAAVVIGTGIAYFRSLRGLARHPGPGLLIAVAALAWWGVVSLP